MAIFNMIGGGGTYDKIVQRASWTRDWNSQAYYNYSRITIKDDAPPIKTLYFVAIDDKNVGQAKNYSVVLNWDNGLVLDENPVSINLNTGSSEPNYASILKIDEHTIEIRCANDFIYHPTVCLIIYTS